MHKAEAKEAAFFKGGYIAYFHVNPAIRHKIRNRLREKAASFALMLLRQFSSRSIATYFSVEEVLISIFLSLAYTYLLSYMYRLIESKC